MTTIKAACPRCGDVSLTPQQVKLWVCTNAPQSSYAFDCPTCRKAVCTSADDNIVSLLVSGGVTAERWAIPKEALEEKSGPPLTFDDLIDLHSFIEGDDFPAAVDALAQALL